MSLRVKPTVPEPLPTYTSEKDVRSFLVLGLAMLPTEIELGEVTLQVLFADVMEGANQAALEQAEVGLTSVGLVVAFNALFGAVAGHSETIGRAKLLGRWAFKQVEWIYLRLG